MIFTDIYQGIKFPNVYNETIDRGSATVVLHLQVCYYTYFLSFAEADSFCFCMYARLQRNLALEFRYCSRNGTQPAQAPALTHTALHFLYWISDFLIFKRSIIIDFRERDLIFK